MNIEPKKKQGLKRKGERKMKNGLTFNLWLEQFVQEDSPLGDFAHDTYYSAGRQTLNTWKELLNHLESFGACEGEKRRAKKAWRRYTACKARINDEETKNYRLELTLLELIHAKGLIARLRAFDDQRLQIGPLASENICALEDYRRRYAHANGVEYSLEQAAGDLLQLALKDKPAEKHFPCY